MSRAKGSLGAVEPVEPRGWQRGRGYSNGAKAPAGGSTLFVAGQIGWDRDQKLVSGGFVGQYQQALSNVLEVVRAAGGEPAHIGRLTTYVVDKTEYIESIESVGRAYRQLMGDHYPAMTLVEVRGLLESDARVEIEATAVLPERVSE